MGLEKTNEVDFIGIDKESGVCTLTIVDSLDWNNEYEHLMLLQEKINLYLSFIESGEIYDSYPPSKDREFEINILFKDPISVNCKEFIKYAARIVKGAGFELTYSIG